LTQLERLEAWLQLPRYERSRTFTLDADGAHELVADIAEQVHDAKVEGRIHEGVPVMTKQARDETLQKCLDRATVGDPQQISEEALPGNAVDRILSEARCLARRAYNEGYALGRRSGLDEARVGNSQQSQGVVERERALAQKEQVQSSLLHSLGSGQVTTPGFLRIWREWASRDWRPLRTVPIDPPPVVSEEPCPAAGVASNPLEARIERLEAAQRGEVAGYQELPMKVGQLEQTLKRHEERLRALEPFSNNAKPPTV
jgi:hypothetical protein